MVLLGFFTFSLWISPAFGLEAALQEKLDAAKGLAQEAAGAVVDEVDYPDGALSALSKAKQAVDLVDDLIRNAEMSENGELSIQAIQLINDAAISTAGILDAAPSPKDPAVLESALNIADTAAKALLIAAETARNTGNTELALGVVQAGGNVDEIIHAILQTAISTENPGSAASALAAEDALSETIRLLAGYAKTAGNSTLARQAAGVAENHSAILQRSYEMADFFADSGLAEKITQILRNYAGAILAVAQLAEAAANQELGQMAVNEAYLLATTLCRALPMAEYAISVGEDLQTIRKWENILSQIQNAETAIGEAVAAGVASGAASPARPPCAPGPGGWWKEPLLDDARIAEDEDAASPIRP